MLENLDDPRRVWERIVENELTDEAVHLLEVLFTFGSAGLEDLEESWRWYRKEMDRAADGRTFRRALQVLDGTMVSAERGQVAFHNPSIEDYFRFHLGIGRAHLPELLRAFVCGEQVRRLLAAARMADGAGLLARLREHEPAVATAVQEIGDDVETGLSDEDESRSSRLEWVLETADLLDSSKLTAYVMRETLPPFTHYEHFPHLMSLADSLDASPLVSQEHAERFREEVADAVYGELVESVEAGDWYRSISLHKQLRRTRSRASREPVTQGLVRCALEELGRLAAEPEREPRIAYLEPLEELVDFLMEHGAEEELPEVFSVVYRRAERVFAAREAERNEWFRKGRILRDPSEPSDAARDHALVTELMRKLDDTH
jgi:hypothetical protein